MIIFTVNIFLFLIVLGVWLLMNQGKDKQKQDISGIEVTSVSKYHFSCWLLFRFLMLVFITPQFRSIIPCEVLLYIEVTFLGFIH